MDPSASATLPPHAQGTLLAADSARLRQKPDRASVASPVSAPHTTLALLLHLHHHCLTASGVCPHHQGPWRLPADACTHRHPSDLHAQYLQSPEACCHRSSTTHCSSTEVALALLRGVSSLLLSLLSVCSLLHLHCANEAMLHSARASPVLHAASPLLTSPPWCASAHQSPRPQAAIRRGKV
eukprot:4680933-Amphidinium_carterae.1